MVLNFRGGLMVGLDADAGYRATASAVLLVAEVGAAQKQAKDVSAHSCKSSNHGECHTLRQGTGLLHLFRAVV